MGRASMRSDSCEPAAGGQGELGNTHCEFSCVKENEA